MIDKMTEIANDLMSIGYMDVYEESYERMLSILRRSGAVDEEWMPGIDSAKQPVSSPKRTMSPPKSPAGGKMWLYKWQEDGEVFGPFPHADMKTWKQQGFFDSSSVWIRTTADDAFHSLRAGDLN